jgi:hypothetical protein
MKSLRYRFSLFLVLDVLGVLFLSAGPHSKINFISNPVTTAQVGILYSYDADAKSPDSTEGIEYKLVYGPDGMTIDSTSGLVQWIPIKKGYFVVGILARGDSSRFGHQEFCIHVFGAKGRIAGQVVDAATLLPIKNVVVQLYHTGYHVMSRFDWMPTTSYRTTTDTLGMYSIANIDTGVYLAQAVKILPYICLFSYKDEYYPVWWQNSSTIINADQIQVIPDSTITIDFQMVKKVPPKQITVSGLVTDSFGVPIRHALVVISRVKLDSTSEESAQRSILDIDHSLWGCIEDACGTHYTDSSGVFSIKVWDGYTYIASAYAKDFVIQFYNGKTNVLEADLFTPSNDTTGINFRLTPLPPATSSISGSVQDSTGQGVVSRLILFPVQKPFRTKCRTVSSDSLGNFKIEELYDGKYILLAVPYRGYIPAFYKLNSFGVWNWKEADTINLSGEVNGLIVGVLPKSVNGAGVVHGRVRTEGGLPVEGAIVYAANPSGGTPVNFAVTEADGSYELDGLQPDDYTLVADKPEYMAMGTASATIDYGNGGSTAVPDLTFEEVSSIQSSNGTGSTVPAATALYQNYPNPFNPSTCIQFDLPRDARVLLKVFNIIGQEVDLIIDGNQAAGSHIIEFDASQLPTGIYFYRLQVENSVFTRKMILMK